jgi:NADPH:quinone reductase-like Zn-dependent oxidoreductase
MRAAAFTELVGPDGVSIIDQPRPEPAAGEAVLEVTATAINRHDLWILDGDSAMVNADDLPFVTGLDVTGVVHSIGDGVVGVEPGDRVVLCPNKTCGTCQFCWEGPMNLCEEFSLYHGGLAEFACVQADRLVHIPSSISATDAAAVPTAYMTAFRMLRRADVGPHDLVFVPGVTGGVGIAIVQLCTILGARTIGTSSSASKLERVHDFGLDHGIESTNVKEIRDRVASIGTPDVVINHLGGKYTELGQQMMKRGGTMVICGRTAGRQSTIDIPDLFLGHKTVIGSTMGTQNDLKKLIEFMANGNLSPVVDSTYALEQTAEAFAAMKDRKNIGKLVIKP